MVAPGRRRWGLWGIALAVFLLDRAVKVLVVTHLSLYQSIPLVPHVLALTLVLNSGAAFGLLRHRQFLFVLVAVGLLAAVAAYSFRTREIPAPLMWGLGLLAGGSAGNLWDRAVSGRVVDYIHLAYWPVFNLADSAIVVGMAVLMWYFWRGERAPVQTVRERGADEEKRS
ncbi:Lipoprotein signal peptidase [Candidatus Hydrogenisulfobacillus filiaventi]|uniref:Lipoprotein signal peptidase n=1 Tax=Candidatus Hydrogenisulfobacillus filiaventi TaxID=2707344 RepID=A0A6F8ZFK7_9FIRM|nr:signal peptidase II [Bacillota bacterium]CAB1128484.1 Lipoprotein signal peptidase [Candidatus Hydrogenisulfobacillus filiaventi]